jgi:hypothetical protein
VTAPSLIQYAETVWNTSSGASTASITWLAGDVIVVIGGTADSSEAIPTPTFSGGTLAAITGAACTGASDCYANAWSCTPVSGGSGTVSSTGASAHNWGMGVWVWRGSGGVGNVGASGTTVNGNLTQSLVRGGANSCVAGGLFDWAAGATTGYGWTPAVANDRQHAAIGTQYSVYVADWGDQGSPGTASYGITGITSGPFARLLVEITGTGGSVSFTATPGSANGAGAAADAAPSAGTLTAALYAGSATAVTGSWAGTGNAVGSTTGDYATWTDAGTGTSATLELAAFGAAAAVPSGSTVTSVTCVVRHGETPAGQVASATAQAYSGTTPVGSAQALTVADAVHEDTVTFTGLAYADLADLRVRVTVTRD